MSDATTPVILSAVRTPIGHYLGGLSVVYRAAARAPWSSARRSRRAGVDAGRRRRSHHGPGGPGRLGPGSRAPGADPGRHSRPRSPPLTINKVCGSGLKAVMLAAQAIKAGDAECVVAGGQESMSSAPHYVYGMRNGIKAGNQTMVDGMIHDGLWDSFGCCHMGEYAEYTAEKAGVSRAGPGRVRLREPPEGGRGHRGREVQGRDPAGPGPGQGRARPRRGRRVAAEGHQRRDARQAQAGVPEGRRHGDGGQRARAERRRQRAGGHARSPSPRRTGSRRWRGSPATPRAAASRGSSSSRRSSRCGT